MSTEIVVSDKSLPLVIYRNQPVITLAMVDQAHQRPKNTAHRTFANNRTRFVEGEDYYLIDSSQNYEFRRFGINVPPRGLILLTETGYLMLVKSFTDELSWKVQRQLVRQYFSATSVPAVPSRMRMMLVFEDGVLASSKMVPSDAFVIQAKDLPDAVREAMPCHRVVNMKDLMAIASGVAGAQDLIETILGHVHGMEQKLKRPLYDRRRK